MLQWKLNSVEPQDGSHARGRHFWFVFKYKNYQLLWCVQIIIWCEDRERATSFWSQWHLLFSHSVWYWTYCYMLDFISNSTNLCYWIIIYMYMQIHTLKNLVVHNSFFTYTLHIFIIWCETETLPLPSLARSFKPDVGFINVKWFSRPTLVFSCT